MHPHPRAANSKPRRRLSVSFPRTLLPGPQRPPRCPASSAAVSSGRPARGSRVSWPNGDWTWRQIASGCGRFTTATSSPGTGRPTTGPKARDQRPGGGATFPPRAHRDAAPGRSVRSGPGRPNAAPAHAQPAPPRARPPRTARPGGEGSVPTRGSQRPGLGGGGGEPHREGAAGSGQAGIPAPSLRGGRLQGPRRGRTEEAQGRRENLGELKGEKSTNCVGSQTSISTCGFSMETQGQGQPPGGPFFPHG